MRTAVIQPNYLPWRGYFDIIDDVELFVFYDDVQYTKNDWRNRNRLKAPRGAEWITVPVVHDCLTQRICDTRIDWSQPWVRRHINQIKANYGRAKYFSCYAPELFALIERRNETIADLDIGLTLWAMRMLGIETRTIRSSGICCAGKLNERLLAVLDRVGATEYLSGPAGVDYMDLDAFRAAGIAVEVKVYDYPAYEQLWGAFSGEMSVIDLLFNEGPNAQAFLKSNARNRRIC